MSANKWGFPERVGACGLHGVLRVSASPGSLPSSGSTVGLCGFIWGSGRPRWQWTEATGRAMEGWSHNQLTPLSHVSEGGSGERLAAIRRWGQLQPPINDSSTGSQMEIFVGWCFWPNVPSPSSRLKLDGKRWCAWFISQDKTRALDWLLMQNSLSRLHCVSNSWKPNL